VPEADFSRGWGGVARQAPADHVPVAPSARKSVVRTAICVEARQGKLHVFLPPLEHLEHYVQLIGLIEQTAAGLAIPVIIEGYEAPRDSRLQSCWSHQIPA